MGIARQTYQVITFLICSPSRRGGIFFMDWLLELGYIGLFIGSFGAATIIPFSADVLLVAMIMAGADPYIAVGVAIVGNFLGGLTSYGIGRMAKWEWMSKMGVTQQTLDQHKQKVSQWGPMLALLTWVPFVGDVFAVVLGFYRTHFWKTAFWMFVGKSARFIVWALLAGGSLNF